MSDKQSKKLSKYLRGVAGALKQLANEIDEAGELDKESEELMSKIGADILFNAKTYTFLK